MLAPLLRPILLAPQERGCFPQEFRHEKGRRVGQAGADRRESSSRARRWLLGERFVVPLRGSADVSAIRVERGEEGAAAGFRGADPRRVFEVDPALLMTPPRGLQVGFVPIVTRQEAAPR